MDLIVIFRDDAPLIHAGDCPSYRAVTIELTAEQAAKLKCNHDEESVSRTFLQCPEPPKQ